VHRRIFIIYCSSPNRLIGTELVSPLVQGSEGTKILIVPLKIQYDAGGSLLCGQCQPVPHRQFQAQPRDPDKKVSWQREVFKGNIAIASWAAAATTSIPPDQHL
jgi:hypothetical protein